MGGGVGLFDAVKDLPIYGDDWQDIFLEVDVSERAAVMLKDDRSLNSINGYEKAHATHLERDELLLDLDFAIVDAGKASSAGGHGFCVRNGMLGAGLST